MTSDKDAAEAYAKVWLVHATEQLIESLKNPDDVISAFEIAFADGYQTGAAHVRKEAEGLVEAAKHYIKNSECESECTGKCEGWVCSRCLIKDALAAFKAQRGN